MKCSICGITVDSIDEAINNDWIPYFYEGDQVHEFACDSCSETFLELGKDGDMEIKKKFAGKVTFQPAKPSTPKEHLMMGILLR